MSEAVVSVQQDSRYVSVQARGLDSPLAVRTRDLGPPGPGEALVRIRAAGVSYGDILLRAGVIPGGPKPPFTPGFEFAGEVVAVGKGVTGPPVGARVAGLVRSGGYAEHIVVPAARLVRIPDRVSHVEAAASLLNYFIANQMLRRVARVERGQAVVVHGASGGVGIAFLQLARLAGVQVYGTCSAAKMDIVRKFGGHPIDYLTEDFVVEVRRRHPEGVPAVFDAIGGTHFWWSYTALRRGGILVGYGQSAAYQDGKARMRVGALGFIGGIGLPKLRPDGRRTTFYNAWALEKKQPQAYQEDLGEVLRLLGEGDIEPVVGETLPLDRAAEAHELLQRGAVQGKIVLSSDET